MASKSSVYEGSTVCLILHTGTEFFTGEKTGCTARICGFFASNPHRLWIGGCSAVLIRVVIHNLLTGTFPITKPWILYRIWMMSAAQFSPINPLLVSRPKPEPALPPHGNPKPLKFS